MAAGDLRAAGLRERTSDIGARAAQRRKQSAEQSCEHGANERIKHDAPIQMDFFNARQISRERTKDARRAVCYEQTERSTNEGHDKSFGEELEDERAS